MANPLNQRFILLSEACVPIYPPEVLYLQLLSEDKARVNACHSPNERIRRQGGTRRVQMVDRWFGARHASICAMCL